MRRRFPNRLRVIGLVTTILLGWGALDAAEDPVSDSSSSDSAIDFEGQIRPLLKAHCYQCHGPKTQKSGLRLDHRDPAFRGGDSGKVLIPGESGKSELVRRISADSELERMPPPDEGVEPLADDEIALIKRWVEQGAPWPEEEGTATVESDHWAFQPIERPEVPDVGPSSQKGRMPEGWSRNPIDRFVLAKLQKQGIAPSPPADRYTLIKRLYYDLLGLPPTPAEVDAFVSDDSPDAYEKLVDRLLASPHFGERWGRHWLDKARYADSDGYEKDRPRPNAWRYRDWVIDAVNADMPFDCFTVEQLAGDLLPDAGPKQKLATAFHRQTLTNTEGGVDQEEFRVEAVFDRAETTGTVWLGLTVKCARCHSHKYDPLTQREYYRLFAFFNNGDEVKTRVPVSRQAVAEYERARAHHDHKVQQVQDKLKQRRARLAERLPEWEGRLQRKLDESGGTARFHPLEIVDVESENGATFETLEDGSYRVGGKNPQKETYTIRARTEIDRVSGFRIDVLADENLPNKGPGRVKHGNFVLSEFQVTAGTDREFQDGGRLALTAARADFSQDGWPVAGAVDGNGETGWAISPKMGEDHFAVFSAAEPIESDGETWLKFELAQDYGKQHTIGRFRIRAMTGIDVPQNIRDILAVAPSDRTDEQKETLLDFSAARDPKTLELQRQLASLENNAPEEPLMQVRILSQRTENPRSTHLLHRGDFLQPKEEVRPGPPAVLHEFEPREKPGRPNRLDLARWIVDPDNPLTPRVTVNHIWEPLFGRGLVRTMNDFGTRGEPPTHPQLLDWLAAEFLRRDWSRKEMIRVIVTSATYRQSSVHRSGLAEVDPRNDLLARQNRFRTSAEVVRDLNLSASGLLAHRIGGPSVFPPMPPDVADLSYANNFQWETSEGRDRYRRGLYTFFKRTAPHPNLTTFDCPSANTATVERSISNTPLQALTTLNNKVFVEASQAMARHVLQADRETVARTVRRNSAASGVGDEERLIYLFRRCVARPPSPPERDRFLELLQTSRDYYADHPDQARELVGRYAVEGLPVEEAAAWTATARIVLNLDEFITRE